MHHNNITTILGLTEFDATFMMENDAEIFIRIEKKTTAELCPCCQELSQKVHQRRRQLVKDLRVPFKHAARLSDVSPTTAKRYFDEVAAELAHKGIKAPKWLALDEFAGTNASGKYHLAVAKPQTKKLLDILPEMVFWVQYMRD